MKKLIIFLFLIITSNIFAQKKYYNSVVSNYQGDSSNELIELIKGTTLLNYDFKDINGKVISTEKVKKPLFIAVVSTRAAPFWAGIPALNKIIEKNHDKIQFILIFKDDEERIKKVSSKINEHIALIPPREGDKLETGNFNVSGFLHKIKDYPTGYLISKRKEITNVVRGAAVPNKTMSLEKAIEVNYGVFKQGLGTLVELE